mmetsp:Transcript_24476/g.60727  ORF Transcript_24476/g.60727 Transcript_24476/m.60727 type:complete len:576 (-) Transcript_24476:168-1895(-)
MQSALLQSSSMWEAAVPIVERRAKDEPAWMKKPLIEQMPIKKKLSANDRAHAQGRRKTTAMEFNERIHLFEVATALRGVMQVAAEKVHTMTRAPPEKPKIGLTMEDATEADLVGPEPPAPLPWEARRDMTAYEAAEDQASQAARKEAARLTSGVSAIAEEKDKVDEGKSAEELAWLNERAIMASVFGMDIHPRPLSEYDGTRPEGSTEESRLEAARQRIREVRAAGLKEECLRAIDRLNVALKGPEMAQTEEGVRQAMNEVLEAEKTVKSAQAAYLEAEAALGDVDRRSVIVRSPLAPSLRLGHVLNPRSHVRNSQRGGKPRGALGYCSEGPPFGKKFVEPLDPMLEAYSVTREEWESATAALRRSWSALSREPTIKQIEALNYSLFGPKRLVAVYAEYGMGQKAMTVYSEQVFAIEFPEAAEDAVQRLRRMERARQYLGLCEIADDMDAEAVYEMKSRVAAATLEVLDAIPVEACIAEAVDGESEADSNATKSFSMSRRISLDDVKAAMESVLPRKDDDLLYADLEDVTPSDYGICSPEFSRSSSVATLPFRPRRNLTADTAWARRKSPIVRLE